MVFYFSLISPQLYRATQHPHVRTPPHISDVFLRCSTHVNWITQCQISALVHLAPATRPTHFVALYVISCEWSLGPLDNDMVSPKPCPTWGTHGMKVVLNTIELTANDYGGVLIVGWADGWIEDKFWKCVFQNVTHFQHVVLFRRMVVYHGWGNSEVNMLLYMIGVLNSSSYVNNCLLKLWCHMMACRWRMCVFSRLLALKSWWSRPRFTTKMTTVIYRPLRPILTILRWR